MRSEFKMMVSKMRQYKYNPSPCFKKNLRIKHDPFDIPLRFEPSEVREFEIMVQNEHHTPIYLAQQTRCPKLHGFRKSVDVEQCRELL